MKFRRKIYKRGSSFETTLPMPILFALDDKKRYYAVFKYDAKTKRWYIEFEDIKKK